ncbi:hypothetical protein [Candidatus Binatus sp.]|uniref:hypothetical protein n=1 Tax=Candidatus Binatus sp. TaxID=2811406 RepID=UPI00272AA15B|nr:hypothetical protein [Candidatus Binatus sp.]
MQIGNAALDTLCEKAIVPALNACDLDAKRVDKHNEGGLLKSEIIRFIESSEIIIADLTNERPNCYLEVGCAMGVGKFRNLILTAREDHMPDYPDRRPGGPKLHFDLSGYDVLFWRPDALDTFRVELEKKIRRRQAILAPPMSQDSAPSWSSEWFKKQIDEAKKSFVEYGKKGFMELKVSLVRSRLDVGQQQLLDAASKSVIRTFGWPIGVVMTKAEYRPRPTAEGIVAEILTGGGGSYDYWSLRRNGDFYLLRDLFEDDKRPEQDQLFINTRIVQVTEAILYCGRLYSNLGLPPTQTFAIVIRHGGLKGRTLAWAGFSRLEVENDYSCSVDESSPTLTASQAEIEGRLTELVKAICAPLFTLFNFFVVPDETYDNIVNSFVAGRVI